MEDIRIVFSNIMEKLLKQAHKNKNVLEYKEINDAFKNIELTPEKFEWILDYFEKQGVDVLNTNEEDDGDDNFIDDDTEEVEAVTLRITFMQDKEVYHDDIRLFGKTIASAYGRDSGAKLGKDAVLIKGNACSGGSVKNWRTIIVAESVILLNNVPRQMYEKKKGVYDPEEIKIEIVENDKIDINKLKEEKERLLKRIAEIDKVLTANAGEF